MFSVMRMYGCNVDWFVHIVSLKELTRWQLATPITALHLETIRLTCSSRLKLGIHRLRDSGYFLAETSVISP